MNLKLALKWLFWRYQKSQLGAIGEYSNVSILADIRGDKKNISLGNNVTICKHATLEVDPSNNDKSKIIEL